MSNRVEIRPNVGMIRHKAVNKADKGVLVKRMGMVAWLLQLIPRQAHLFVVV